MSASDTCLFSVDSGIPYFDRSGLISRSTLPARKADERFHYDLLMFMSLAAKFGVDFVTLTWQPALERLGQGASSTVQQGQIDAHINLAFKRAKTDLENYSGSENPKAMKFKTIIFELVALELLRNHPNVGDLLGVAWETDAETKEVWPVLLTERSTYGNMATFLDSEDGRTLSTEEKLKLLEDIAGACLAMHRLGIVHGDIKLENVLVFKKDKRWTAKLIDFGYSCLGTSEDDLVQVFGTRPWQAPENEDQYFRMSAARRMDVYLFGTLATRTMLSDAMPSTIGKVGKCKSRKEAENLLQRIEEMKSSDELLDSVYKALRECKTIEEKFRDSLDQVFRITLQHKPSRRCEGFANILSVLASGTDIELEGLRHEVLQIQDYLGDLDDVDYLLHEMLVKNLVERVEGKQCVLCRTAAAYQLALCYEIGFGVKRDRLESERWISRAREWDSRLPDIDDTLENIKKSYEARNPDRILQTLGYETNLPWNPIELYQDQQRLETAEKAFRNEIDGRTQSMGISSKSRLNLLETLALILAARKDLGAAETVCRMTVEGSVAAFGEDDDQTVQAQNFLAYVLQLERKYAELEALERRLVSKKLQAYGATDGTTLASRNRFGAALFFQGHFEECLNEMQDLTSTRHRLLGPGHPQTLVTERYVPRCLLALGRLEEAEWQQRSVLEREEKALGVNADSVLDNRVTLTEILLEARKLDEAISLNSTFLDVDGIEEQEEREPATWLRIKAIQVRIATDSRRPVDDAKTNLENSLDSCRGFLSADNVDVLRAKKVLASAT
ncbi:MAG: hypothetical protein Q9167_004095 [Letrouitia subvulpina]